MSNIDLKGAFDRAKRFHYGGKIAEALPLYQDIAALSQEEGDVSRAAAALHMAGDAVRLTIKRSEESKFRVASAYFGKAYAMYGSIDRKDRQGAVLRDIAITADRVGWSAVALESFQRSIQFLGEVEDTAEQAATYDKLGLHFTLHRQPDTGLMYMDKALELLRQTPTQGWYRASTLLDRAVTHLALKNVDRSFEDAEEALGWFAADHDDLTYVVCQAQCTGLMAYVSERRNDSDNVQKYTRELKRLLQQPDAEVAAHVEADLEQWASL